MGIDVARGLTRSLVVSLALACAGCATNVYKSETDRVGDSAKTLAEALSAPGPNGAATLDLTTDLLLLGGPIRYDAGCGEAAFAAYEGVIRAAPEDKTTQDRAYAALLETPACDLSSAPSALPAKQPAGASDRSDAAPGADGRRLEREEAQRMAAQARTHGPDRPSTRPLCKGSCTLEDYTRQISAYGEAIEQAGKADDVADAQAAVGNAGAAADGLLKAAKAPPLAAPIVDLAAGLGKLAIQQARYAAMRRAVLVFDAAWVQAAPAVEEAARLRQAERISVLADAAQSAALAAQQYVNDDRYFHSPSERLRLFESLNAKVETADAALAAARIDPATSIAAFTKANHALALALENPRRQATTLRGDVKSLEDEVAAVHKASAPAPGHAKR